MITRIVETPGRPHWRRIYLDGKPALLCSVNVVARFGLRPMMELSEASIEAIRVGQIRQECFDTAMRFLQRRMHSRTQLQTKLARKEFDQATIAEVLSELERLGYVDDARFAQVKAMSLAQHRHHGPHRAQLELLKSGIPPETARQAVQTVYQAQDTEATARELARKQAPRLRRLDPAVARRRLIGILLRRGFDYDTIRPVIQEVLGEQTDSASEDVS